MDDQSFSRLLEFFDLSRRGYRKVRRGVKKRITRHMQELHCRNVEDYLGILRENPEEMEKTGELLTVSISRFFRDRRLWEVLEERVIPALVRDFETTIRVWSAGCANGEEVYSLKILWEWLGRQSLRMPSLHILATDRNPAVLEKARAGIYSPSSLKEVNEPLRNEYFIPLKKDLFAIRHDLKAGIHWTQHDLTTQEPPETDFDLIFLRNNLLTYYEAPVRNPALAKVVNALRRDGYLIIGNKEELPSMDLPLKQSPEYRCLFKKVLL